MTTFRNEKHLEANSLYRIKCERKHFIFAKVCVKLQTQFTRNEIDDIRLSLSSPIDFTLFTINHIFEQKNVADIGNSLSDMFEFGGENPAMLWKPVIEPDFGQERFLTDDPTKLFKSGQFMHVPVLAGISKYELLHPAICEYERSNYELIHKKLESNSKLCIHF